MDICLCAKTGLWLPLAGFPPIAKLLLMSFSPERFRGWAHVLQAYLPITPARIVWESSEGESTPARAVFVPSLLAP